MKLFLRLIFAAFLINTGCKQPVAPVDKNPWSVLTIRLENYEEITINNIDDTSKVKFYDKGTFLGGYHKLRVDSVKSYFTMAEKDTLYQLVEEIIAKPINPKHRCTDFVGELSLVVDYGKFLEPGSYRQSAHYSGICNVDSLSDAASHLNKILERKIKKVVK
ncbi:hypothetical protein [Mucilaginibacter gotjawali]|uniref:Uncharacterized protein n=2 Tax=Mucilaginibacter gotjawali TaxID=1550579 RepID=A0A0X8X183_9SPHI|nr:hypothetical protein [Mucilaginibacter gotjawali]MBB3053669.1 hypothetical protein [Mucilaginibacter gotjawali]BAU53929.1 hypothetical protein MgSA37_02100 [Mucilaginibacter gotjawali]